MSTEEGITVTDTIPTDEFIDWAEAANNGGKLNDN